MTLNATIIVQIIHFLVGYLLISRFLLKPAYQILAKEQEYVDGLQHKVEHEEQRLQQKQEEKQDDLMFIKRYFHEHKPAMRTETGQSKRKINIQVASHDKQALDKLEQQVAHAVTAKLTQAKT